MSEQLETEKRGPKVPQLAAWGALSKPVEAPVAEQREGKLSCLSPREETELSLQMLRWLGFSG